MECGNHSRLRDQTPYSQEQIHCLNILCLKTQWLASCGGEEVVSIHLTSIHKGLIDKGWRGILWKVGITVVSEIHYSQEQTHCLNILCLQHGGCYWGKCEQAPHLSYSTWPPSVYIYIYIYILISWPPCIMPILHMGHDIHCRRPMCCVQMYSRLMVRSKITHICIT